DTRIDPGPGFNLFCGDNGQGKSNLLEAVDYVACLRSFRGAGTADLIQRGRECATLAMSVQDNGPPRTQRVLLQRAHGRRLSVDGKRPRSRSAYFKGCQAVLFHPGDNQLVLGSPEGRRAFLDRILEQIDPTYASALTTYQRALRSRNRLLRQPPAARPAVQSYDPLLASAGAVLGASRALLVEALGAALEPSFRQISGDGLAISARYLPRVEPRVELLARALAEDFDKDTARGFTGRGPHADELELRLNDEPARHHASQGQQRTIVLALKLAELRYFETCTGRRPLLLLDDVSSELDPIRSQRFFGLLRELAGQVFVTTTRREYVQLGAEHRVYHVDAGVVSLVD
ncbi:MAG: DNA replication and repair protein RecF, partial [Proteobacteria bacterium]|nr:DNA replication and repair protein RecF [Pseudomonadota bacterium]